MLGLFCYPANAAIKGLWIDYCDSYSSGSVGYKYCNGTYVCGTSGSAFSQSYPYCGVVDLSDINDGMSKMLLCFSSQEHCETMVARCPSNYYGDDVIPDITRGAGSPYDTFTLSNYEQFACCQSCTGYTYTDNTTVQLAQRKAKSCTTSGTCSTINAGWTCLQGWYSSNNKSASIQTKPIDASSELVCKTCASGTGHSAATSPYASSNPKYCYLPAGTTDSDDTGTYKYTSNCYYGS